MTPEAASDIAISGLQYIAGDTEELSRFVALTGIAPNEFRAMVSTSEFMAAILDYFLSNEPTLLAFTAQAGIEPNSVKTARYTLVPPSESEVF